MNIRDQFAFASLKILLQDFEVCDADKESDETFEAACDQFAGSCRSAYYMADAMLAERGGVE